MSAASYTPDEEARYGMAPLPDPAPMDAHKARRLNQDYSVSRMAYRELHPHAPKVDFK